MNAAQLFVSCLEWHAIEYIFWVPWEENLDLLEAIRTSSIKLIVTRNEQTAVFMAATYGRLTWKAWVALSTLWPGATNMITGIAHAQLGWMPVLVITGQKPIKKSKQAKFQIIDQVALMKPITKFTTSIVDPSRVPNLVAYALQIAEEEKPGAVHIELPEDIAREDASWILPITKEKLRRPIPDLKAIQRIIDKLKHASTPLILVWAWANRKRVTTYLWAFIKQYNIPFFCSQMWKGVLDERMDQYIGTAALTSNDYIHTAIQKADCIIAVGYDIIEKPVHLFSTENHELIHINFFAAEYDTLYQPSLQVVWDIGNIFWQLSQQQIQIDHWHFEALYDAAQHAKEQHTKTLKAHNKHEQMMPWRLISEIRSVLDDDDIVALDNGLYKVWFARNYPTYSPNTLLLDNALATMWAWYAIATSAKLLNPDKHVIAVVGDWWIVMNLWDLETVVRLRLNITIIILNDNAYGMIKWKQNDQLHSFPTRRSSDHRKSVV